MVARKRTIIALLALPLVVYAVLVAVPLCYSLYISLTRWDGLSSQPEFIGLANYGDMLTDQRFWGGLGRTLVWSVFGVAATMFGGLALALLLHRNLRGSRFFKTLFFLPIALSLAVVAQVWLWIYHPDLGLLNISMRATGFGEFTQAWLGDPTTALPAVMLAWAWQQIPLCMVIYLAGLTSVPEDLREAAALDGASRWQTLRSVVLPMLKPSTVVAATVTVINSFKGFDVVYILTKGGPFYTSETLSYLSYTEAFNNWAFGYGSAIAIVLLVIAIILVAIYFKVAKVGESLHD